MGMHLNSVIITSLDVLKQEPMPHARYAELKACGLVVVDNGDDYSPVDFYPKRLSEHGRLIQINVDYWGGGGEQTADLYEHGELVRHVPDSEAYGAVNTGLKWLGVERQDGMDEWDTVGLGYWRDNGEICDSGMEVPYDPTPIEPSLELTVSPDEFQAYATRSKSVIVLETPGLSARDRIRVTDGLDVLTMRVEFIQDQPACASGQYVVVQRVELVVGSRGTDQKNPE
jgi:hypothetical protein